MTKTRMMTFAALGAALTTLLPAQTAAKPNANRFIPENSSFVVRVASPAKWRKQFGQTQVAKLGEAQSLAPFVGMLSQRMEMGLEMMRDSGMFDADLAESMLNTWMGDIVFSVQIDWDGFLDAMDFGETPPMSLVVALSPDGSFDLGAVAKEFNALIDQEAPEGALKDLAVGDLTLRVASNGGDEPDFTMPTMIDGHLVFIGGTSLEKDAAKLLRNEGRFAAQDTSPLFVHADIGRLMTTLLEADAGGAPFDPAEMMDMIGISALKSMSLSVKPDGKSIAGELHIGMKKDNRGLFGMMSTGNQQPKLLGSVPPNSEAFGVSAIDLGAFLRTIESVWGLAEDVAPMTFDDAMAMFTEATKVDLKKDLFGNLGKEMLQVQDPDALKNIDPDDMEDNPAAMLAGTVYGIALSNGDAFGAALDTMIRSRGMHVGRKSEAYANAEIHRMKLAGMVDIEYSVTNNLLLVGIGSDRATGRILRDIIDTRASGEATTPAILAKRAGTLAPGWNGIAITPIGAIIEGAMMGLQASGQFGEEMDMVTQVVRGVVADMKRLGIGSMVQASYCDDNGFTASLRW
tara:strand:- start:44149 stop:45864 length:1716 start_codon:yes stop_codon:yes gene_type:complete